MGNQPPLLGSYHATRRELETRLARIEATRPRDQFTLVVGAAVDFAVQALVGIERAISDPNDNSTGKGHVLARCEELVALLARIDHLEALGSAKGLEPDFRRVLDALEVDCATYGFARVTTDEDVERMLAEVPPLDPRTAHD